MTGDLSQVNFSSMRAGLVEFRQMVQAEQWLALAPMVLRPVAQRFQVTARLAGKQREAIKPFVWTAPKLQWVDPLKDVMATKEALRGTLMSLSEAIRERGDDPDRVFAEIRKEREQLRAMGILSDADPAVSERLIDAATVADLTAQ